MKTMFGNLWTTVLGIVTGMLSYTTTTGAKIPGNKQEWLNLVFSAFLAAIGIAAKDATTGSKPSS